MRDAFIYHKPVGLILSVFDASHGGKHWDGLYHLAGKDIVTAEDLIAQSWNNGRSHSYWQMYKCYSRPDKYMNDAAFFIRDERTLDIIDLATDGVCNKDPFEEIYWEGNTLKSSNIGFQRIKEASIKQYAYWYSTRPGSKDRWLQNELSVEKYKECYDLVFYLSTVDPERHRELCVDNLVISFHGEVDIKATRASAQASGISWQSNSKLEGDYSGYCLPDGSLIFIDRESIRQKVIEKALILDIDAVSGTMKTYGFEDHKSSREGSNRGFKQLDDEEMSTVARPTSARLGELYPGGMDKPSTAMSQAFVAASSVLLFILGLESKEYMLSFTSMYKRQLSAMCNEMLLDLGDWHEDTGAPVTAAQEDLQTMFRAIEGEWTSYPRILKTLKDRVSVLKRNLRSISTREGLGLEGGCEMRIPPWVLDDPLYSNMKSLLKKW